MTGDPSAGAALTTLGLRKRYGARAALDGLDLAVPRGVVYGFLGPNGAGKTTTLRLLVGLIRPDAGQIEVLGRPYSWRDRRRLFDVGALIETPAFYPYLSGRDNLRVVGASGPPAPTSRVEEVLDFVGMRERGKDKFKTYSLGMKQRLGIAAAMLNDPQLLLLDEPLAALDVGAVLELRTFLHRHLRDHDGVTVLVTHDAVDALVLADRLVVLDRGQIVEDLPTARVEQARHPATVELLDATAPVEQLVGQHL